MGSTFLSINLHIVFSTKDRRPLIAANWRPRLHAYLGGTAKGLGAVPIAINGVADHVHILAGVRATHCLADFMQELKKASSIWAAEIEPEFKWQEGYSAFSVSYTHIEAVRKYIATQEEHHRKHSFIDELERLLKKNGVEYNPKYLL